LSADRDTVDGTRFIIEDEGEEARGRQDGLSGELLEGGK